MRKKMLTLATILVSAFSANLAAPTCTLDLSGTCKCTAIIEYQTIIGYQCVEESSDVKCLCSPPPES